MDEDQAQRELLVGSASRDVRQTARVVFGEQDQN
jgi:hypothetical protein